MSSLYCDIGSQLILRLKVSRNIYTHHIKSCSICNSCLSPKKSCNPIRNIVDKMIQDADKLGGHIRYCGGCSLP